MDTLRPSNFRPTDAMSAAGSREWNTYGAALVPSILGFGVWVAAWGLPLAPGTPEGRLVFGRLFPLPRRYLTSRDKISPDHSPEFRDGGVVVLVGC
jgi:hypothetical protein